MADIMKQTENGKAGKDFMKKRHLFRSTSILDFSLMM